MPRRPSAPPADKPLSLREAAFCDEYLVDGIAGRAYERAGYKARGNAAEVEGGKKLRDARVAARIATLQAARSKRVTLDADWVLRQLRGNLRDAREAGNHAAANKALHLLGKHVGLFSDRVTVATENVLEVVYRHE